LRTAACDALGQLDGDKELEPLVRMALRGEAHATDAARLVAGRVGDKAAVAKHLLTLVEGLEPQGLVSLFDILGALGGTEALTAIETSTSSTNDQVKDAAIRELAGWADFAATKPLLVIAADPKTKLVHGALAIEAVARLVTDSTETPKAARAEAAIAALAASKRPEEKKRVLSALATVPDAKAAAAIKPLLNDPDLRAEADLAGATLAEALVATDKAAAKDLAQAIQAANPSEAISRRAEAILNK
jgi:hypothetical protein